MRRDAPPPGNACVPQNDFFENCFDFANEVDFAIHFDFGTSLHSPYRLGRVCPECLTAVWSMLLRSTLSLVLLKRCHRGAEKSALADVSAHERIEAMLPAGRFETSLVAAEVERGEEMVEGRSAANIRSGQT